MLFLSIQQELDCINDGGSIIGKIKFDADEKQHVFYQPDGVVVISDAEQAQINERLVGLDAGRYSIPMQDDD